MKKNLIIKRFLTAVLLWGSVVSVDAQAIVTIFSNAHSDISGNSQHRGFDLDRCYIGYQHKFTPEWSAKVVYDMGSSKLEGSDLERIGYVKNALVKWEKGNWSLSGGLLGTEMFNTQEKFWGYRYIRKAFQDEYKYGSSADLGLVAKYKFAPWISIDGGLYNGEGYKKLNADNRFRYGVGLTVKPIEEWVIRAYVDRYDAPEGSLAQHDLALFTGYKTKAFSIGAEYNYLQHTKFKDNRNQDGLSVYATVKCAEKLNAFGRFDDKRSEGQWDNSNDGQFILLGLQYAPIKNIRIAPNLRAEIAADGSTQYQAYLNVMVGL